MVRAEILPFAILCVGCAAANPPTASTTVLSVPERPADHEVVVVLPQPEADETADEREAEPPARGLPSPEPVDEAETRCVALAADVDARAAWLNPTMLRLELGPPPDGASYSDREPTNLVGATLSRKVITRESNVLFLNLNALRVGVLANVPLECDGSTRRIRVIVMPNSGKLQFGNEFHLVKRDVP